MTEFKSEYMNELVRGYACRCGVSGSANELINDYDIDRVHPRNKGLGPHDTLFKSHYLLCPRCKRVIVQDGQYLGV